MKKYFTFILGILLIAVLAAPLAGATTDVAFDVIGTAGTGATYDISFSSIFSSEEDLGQDLYDYIYNKVKSEGSDLAVKRLLARRPLSKEELGFLIPGSNIGELLSKPNPQDELQPGQVVARHDELIKLLEDEKELADLEVLSEMEVAPTEIFANGDESDSGFDLIVDLDIIETILFAKSMTVAGGGGPGAPAGSDVLEVGGEGAAEDEKVGEKDKKKVDDKEKAGVKEGGLAGGPTGEEAAEEPGPIHDESSGMCIAKPSFNSAVTAFLKKEQALESGGAKGEGGGAEGGQGSKKDASGETGSGSGASNGEESIDYEKEPLVPGPAANWKKEPLCAGPFCLTIEEKYKKESSYLANENCVECHFEKINDAFKKTLGHNLVPSKVTGNLIEGPKCKRSLFNLAWNVILIPQPILTPPNDDLVIKADFTDNFMSFINANNPFCEKKKDMAGKLKYVCEPDKNRQTRVTQKVLLQASDNKSMADAFGDIRREIQAQQKEAEKVLKQVLLTTEAESGAVQFRVLSQELDTMTLYFEGFKNLYNKLTSGGNDSPCKVLENKSTCN